MKLADVLKSVPYEVLKGSCEIEVASVAYDSRKVEAGALFVCVSGFKTDGHQFIGQVVEKGAVAVVVTNKLAYKSVGAQCENVILVSDARETLALISANWFGHPAQKLTIIGVTGTKGKTTVTHMLKSILNCAGYKVGMIGTLGAYIGEERIPTGNTTPESYELHSLFDRMLKNGCQYVVMEVSSQALKLKRTYGILFDYAAFLNLSPDHISENEHKDFEEYLQCKKLLFDQAKKIIVNIDDSHWREMMENHTGYTTISCNSEADFMASSIQNLWQEAFLGVTFLVSGRFEAKISLSVPGRFNVENALVAIAIAHDIGMEQTHIVEGLVDVSVKGRTQLIKETAHFATFIIDYAHNELSMENLLSMLKDYHPKRLICLFGGGGNKPKQRRFDMGKIAGKYADCTILTTDNPRFESVENINEEIIEGLNVYHGKYKIILDREEAIHYLIDNSSKGDIVALIGKGHEEYQDIRGTKFYFSEEQVIKKYLMTK